MQWDSGYAVSYYGRFVDPVTWSDGERFEIISGTISKTGSGLRDSADLSVDIDIEGERLIRIYMDATQDEDISHTALFTGYATSPKTQYNGTIKTHSVPCYSVLEPANDILLPLGWYANRGADGANIIKNLLGDIDVEGDTKKLTNYIVAESNETRLSMVDKILDAMGWILRIDGMGHITIMPEPSEYSIMLSSDFDVVGESISIEDDLFNVPNVFRATIDGTSAIARDESDASPYSIQNRGREIWAYDDNAELSNDESLAIYAKRMLKYAQRVGKTINYTRRFYPDLYVGDIARFNYDNINGDYRITDQKLSLSYNCETSETGVAI